MILTICSFPEGRISGSAAIRAARAKKEKKSRISAFRKDVIIPDLLFLFYLLPVQRAGGILSPLHCTSQQRCCSRSYCAHENNGCYNAGTFVATLQSIITN